MQVSDIPDVAAARPLFPRAMNLYVEFFGKPRGTYGGEMGTLARGVSKKRKKIGADGTQTEVSLMKKQRAALEHLATVRPAGRQKTMFGTAMPGPADVASVWTDRHADLSEAFKEKLACKVAEARETTKQGLRASCTAPLKTMAKKSAARRIQKMHDDMAKAASRGAARRYDAATCYIAAKNISPVHSQRTTEDLRKADIIITGRKLEKPDWRAAHAMVTGKVVAEGTDLSKSRYIKWQKRPETMTSQCLVFGVEVCLYLK